MRREMGPPGDATLSTMFRLYAVGGVIEIVVSALTFVVLVSNRFLTSRLVLFIFLAFFNMISGISDYVAGVGSEEMLKRSNFLHRYSSWECMTTKAYPMLTVFSAQAPAMVKLLVAVESFYIMDHLSRRHPLDAFYRQLKTGFYGTAALLVLLGFAVLMSYTERNEKRQGSYCSIMQSVGLLYGTMFFFLISAVYLISCCITIMTLLVTIDAKVGKTKIKQQCMLCLMMITAALMNGIPYFTRIIYTNGEGDFETSDFWFVASFFLTCTSPLADFILYFSFLPSFRIHTIWLLTFGRSRKTMNAELSAQLGVRKQ